MPVNVPTGGFGLKLQIVDAFSQNLKKYGTAVGAAQVKTKGLRGAVERHAGAIRKMGMMTAVAGGVITAAFALAVRTSGQFEQSMANVAAVAGATGDQLKRLSGFAREQARVTIFTASETADAMYYLASAGYGVQKMMKALPGVLALTAATGSDLAEVTSSVVATLNQFELQAEDAARVSNVFAAAIGKSQATMGKLGISMSYAGTQADALDMSLEQTTAILSKIYDLGIDASMAGTQFRMAMIRLVNPTKKVHTTLKELGLTYEDIDPKIHNVVDTLRLLKDRGIDLGQSVDIWGARAGSTFYKLGAKADDIDKLTKSITGTNAAVEMSDKMVNTWQGTLKLLKSAIQEVQLIIGDALLPVLTPMVKKFKEVVLRMGEWMKAHPKLTTMLIKFGAVLGPVLIALGGLMMILPSLVAAIPALAGAFAALTGPVGLTVLAITALVAAFTYFYTTNKGFRNFIDAKILPPLKKVWEGLKVVVKALKFMIVNWKATWEAARQISDTTFGQMKKMIWKFFTDWSVFKAGLNLFAQFGKSLVTIWIDTWKTIGTVLGRVTSIVWAPLLKSLQWIADNIEYYFALGIEKARNAIIEGVNWITFKVFTPMANFFIDVANKMIEGVQAFINFFIRGMNVVTEAIKPVISALSWFAKHILRLELPDAIKEFGGIVEVEFGKIEKLGKDALDIKIPESTLKEPAKFATRMSEAWQTIKDQYSKIPGDLQKYVDNLVTEWENVTKAAGEFGTVVDWSDYIGELNGIIKRLKEAGVDTTALEKATNKGNAAIVEMSGTVKGYAGTMGILKDKIEEVDEELLEQLKRLRALRESEYYRGLREWIKRQQEQKERADAYNEALAEQKKKFDKLVETEYYRGITEWLKRQQEQKERADAYVQVLAETKKKFDELVKNEYYRGITEWLKREQEKKKRADAYVVALTETKKKFEELIKAEYYRGIKEWLKRQKEQKERADAYNDALAKTKKKFEELVRAEYYRGITEWLKREKEKKERADAYVDSLTAQKKKFDELVKSEYYRGIMEWLKRQQEMKDRADAYSDALAETKKKFEELVRTEYYRGITEWLKRQQEMKEREEAYADALADTKKKYDELVASEYYRGIVEWLKRQQEQLQRMEDQVILVKSLQEAWNEYYRFLKIANINSLEDFAAYWAYLTDEEKKHLEEGYNAWEAHAEALSSIWDSFTSSVKSSFSDMFYDFMMGTKITADHWQAFCDSMVSSFVKAVADTIVEKLGLDKIFEGNILNLGNLFKGLGNLVVGVFKGIGNVIGGIFGGIGGAVGEGALGGTTVVAGQLAETGAVAEATAAKMGIMQKIGLGLQSVVTGIGGALKYFATMGSGATTVLGALGSGLVGVAGFAATAVAAWMGFSYVAENVIGPVFSGLREGLNKLFGMTGSVNDSTKEMIGWLRMSATQMTRGGEYAEAYGGAVIRMAKEVAAGVRTIGEMNREESIAWLAEAIATNEQFTEEFKNTLMGILEASTEGIEAITEKAKEAQTTAYDATTELYEKTRHLLEQGHNATAKAIAEAVVAVENAIKKTTGATKKAFEQQLFSLQRLNKYGTEAYWRLYNEAKRSFEATRDAQIDSVHSMVDATDDGTGEMVGTTEGATRDMAQSYVYLSRQMTQDMNRMKEEGRVTARDIKNVIALSANQMAQIFGVSTQSMINSLNRVPRRIDFDVVGRLHMPTIPQVGSQSFNIYGQYQAPYIPSYQKGVSPVPKTGLAWLHRGEEVKSAPKVRIEKRGGMGEGNIYNFKMVNYGDINTVADEEALFNKWSRRIKEEVAIR